MRRVSGCQHILHQSMVGGLGNIDAMSEFLSEGRRGRGDGTSLFLPEKMIKSAFT